MCKGLYFFISFVVVLGLSGAAQAESIDVNNFSFEYDVNGNPFTGNWIPDEGLLQAWSVDANWGGTSGISSKDNADTSDGNYCVMGQNQGGSLYQVLPHAIAADKRYALIFDAASWPGGSGDCQWAGDEAMSSIFYPDDGNFPDLNHIKLAGKTFSTPCEDIANTATWSYDLTLFFSADANAVGKSLGIKVGFPSAGQKWSLVDNVRLESFSRAIAWGPSPVDEQTDVGQPVTLIWEAGDYAQDVNGHEVYLGTDFNDVNNANTASTGIYQGAQNRDANSFSPGLLGWAQTYYWRVDEVNEINTTWKGDVWSFTVSPAAATNPTPGTAMWDISILTDLTWTAGAEAVTHEVYFSTDFNDVNNRDPNVKTVESDPCHDPGVLEFSTTYHWAVDEVNLSADPNTWPGLVWSFATKGFISVDDMDSYGADPAMRNVWKDVTTGTLTKNGATISVETNPDLVRSGSGQSMVFAYRNYDKAQNKYVGSEAEASIADLLEIRSDWTVSGAEALVLYFYGKADNGTDHGSRVYPLTDDQMYVALKDGDSKVGIVKYDTEHGYDLNDIKEEEWHEWNIDLADPCLADVNLANVAKVYIGFGGQEKTGQSGPGAGDNTYQDTVWFDDIEVWPPRCRPELVASDFADDDCFIGIWDLWMIGRRWLVSEGNVPAVPAPDTSAGGLLVRYEFEETSGTTANDSSGNGYHGTVSADGYWDPNGYDANGCLDIAGTIDVEVPNDVFSFPMNEITVSMWIKPEVMPLPSPPANIACPFGGGDDEDFWLLVMMYKSWDWDTDQQIPGHEIEFRSSYQESGAYDQIAFHDPNTNGWQGWHHYAFVKDAERDLQSIYRDGELIDQNWWSADRDIQPINPANNKFVIGYSGSTAWEWGRFNARMDDFRIYDRALSHGEIVDLAGKSLVYQPFLEGDDEIDVNNDFTINFGDYVIMADKWLDEPVLWP